jgi:CDP-diacylglycerol--glycerol-3-phosphate 3-phosphatidyltransferase
MNPVVKNIPNALTVLRVLLLPVIVYLYGQDVPGASYAAAWVVLFAALSDIADGILARRLGAQTEFGRWVDPVVDRVFFFSLLAMLWYYDTLPTWAVLPLLLRDGVILLLAIPVRKYTDQGPAVSRWGRGANLALICAIQWFIIDLRDIGWAFYAVGATLYIGSALLYLVRGIAILRRMRAA